MIHSPVDITPEALSELLRQAGALPQGRVLRVDCRAHQPGGKPPIDPAGRGGGEPGHRHALYFLDVQYEGIGSLFPPRVLRGRNFVPLAACRPRVQRGRRNFVPLAACRPLSCS